MSSFIVIKDYDNTGKLIIRFRSSDYDCGYCPFNKGLPALKGSEEVVINFNRPKYIAEILEHILGYYLRDNFPITTKYYDGVKILIELGYVFDYHLSWD